MLKRLMDFADDNPIVTLVGMILICYTVVEILSIVILHHTVDL